MYCLRSTIYWYKLQLIPYFIYIIVWIVSSTIKLNIFHLITNNGLISGNAIPLIFIFLKLSVYLLLQNEILKFTCKVFGLYFQDWTTSRQTNIMLNFKPSDERLVEKPFFHILFFVTIYSFFSNTIFFLFLYFLI